MIVAVVLCAVAVFAAPAEIQDISGRYFDAVHAELQEAKESIWAAIYEIRVYADSKASKPYVLLEDLVDAHKRGVEVKVFLDRSYRYSSVADSAVLHDRNDLAGQILGAAGVKVVFIGPNKRLHAKVIVIDGQIVIDGSVNWSHWALTRNIESASLIRSKNYAGEKLKWIRKIEKGEEVEKNNENEKAEEGECVYLGNEFLLDKKQAPRMVTKQDERVFDLFLLLLKQKQVENADHAFGVASFGLVPSKAGFRNAEGTGPDLTVDYDEMAEWLEITNMTRTAYRRQITKTLKKLEKTYGLIDCEFEYGGPAVVRLCRTDDSKMIEGKIIRKETKDSAVEPAAHYRASGAKISIPVGYWDYGWDRKLSLKAKFMYLVSLYERSRSKMAPWWSRSQTNLARVYDVHKWTICSGLVEIEDMDIIEVRRSEPMPGKGFSDRAPSRYLVKRLKSEEEIAEGWKELELEFGSKTVEKAREIAGKVGSEHSQKSVRDVAAAIEKNGEEAVEKAARRVSKLRRQDSRRNVPYMLGIVRKQRSAK